MGPCYNPAPIMSTIDLYQLLKRIPDVTEDEAKAAADSIAQADEMATKADLETALARLEAKLTRLTFSTAAVVIAAVGVITKFIVG